MNQLLTLDLVPRTTWWVNLRTILPKGEWDRIRRESYRKANYRCEICGGVGPAHPVECHELWEFDDKTRTQKLVGLISLCPACHQVKHFGLAQINGKTKEAIRHLMKVNNWSASKADQHIRESFDEWKIRCLTDWKVDISYTGFDITIDLYKEIYKT